MTSPRRSGFGDFIDFTWFRQSLLSSSSIKKNKGGSGGCMRSLIPLGKYSASDGSRGGAQGARPPTPCPLPLPLLLDQTEARRAEPLFFGDRPSISHGQDD